MWELFQKVLRHGITPNQCFLLFSIHNNTTPSTYIKEDYDVLVEQGYIKDKELTQDALKIIAQLDNYFTVNKKKTTKQLLGKSGTTVKYFLLVSYHQVYHLETMLRY